MELEFRAPVRKTKIDFHRDRASLIFTLKELAVRDQGIIFLDKGLGKIWRHKIIGFGVPSKQMVSLKEGERAKEWHVIGAALEYLCKRNHERKSPVIVIGGGAACDAGALVASLYRRGTPLVLVPTTLLAMVDASIGGKTAVDFIRQGKIYKNFAGTFYSANSVHLWSGWLDTLPKQERFSGVGELMKMLWLAGTDADLTTIRAWINGEEKISAIWPYIESAVQHKVQIVAQDPLDDKGIRSALNYGHTLGHAFESYSKGKIPHGEAVAWGMWAETAFLNYAGNFSAELRERISSLGFTLPKILRGMQAGQVISYLRADKKNKGGKIEMSVLKNFGEIEKISVHPHELAKFAAGIAQTFSERIC